MLQGFLAGLLIKLSVVCMPSAGMAVGEHISSGTPATPAVSRMQEIALKRCHGMPHGVAKPAVVTPPAAANL